MPTRFASIAALLAVLAPLASLPAAAQQRGRGGDADTSNGSLRSFILRNDSKKPITGVSLGSTAGGDLYTGQDQVRPSEAMNVRVGRAECLRSVAVTFADGTTLNAQNLNECSATTIRVADDKISLASSAVQ